MTAALLQSAPSIGRRLALAASLALAPPLAQAEDVPGSSRFTPAQTRGPAPVLPECTCRAGGQTFTLGATICLPGTQGSQLFRCALDLNVTSWQSTGAPCPLS